MNKHIQNILTIVLTLIIINSEGVLYAYNNCAIYDNTPLLSVRYYDMEGNEVERHSRNHSGGMEHEKKIYSLTSQGLQAAGVPKETAETIDGCMSMLLTGGSGTISKGVSITTKVSSTSTTAVSEAVMESHHIIPKQHMGHQLVKEAIKEGFKFNGPENIIRLEKFSKVTNIGRHGNHPAYNNYVEILLDQQLKCQGTAAERLKNVITNLRTTIETNPNIKINNLFK